MELGLKDKVALVTGAGSPVGFGRAISLTLAQEGCDIIVNDINLDDAKKTAAEVESLGCRAVAIKADVTKKAEVEEMVATALARFGRIDILVNNAGATLSGGAFVKQKEEGWDQDIALNLKGTMFCAQAVLPGMVERKSGKIVNISSGSVKIVHAGVSAYTIAKAGVITFTRGLARQVITQGINVNSVAPGWSLTNFIRGDKEAIQKMFLPETPIGRGTEPQDVANIVAFLVSDVSADIVGQVISVDGGSTMQ